MRVIPIEQSKQRNPRSLGYAQDDIIMIGMSRPM